MNPLRALRDQIVAAPEDLGLRRVYADMLVERGAPRGEFIHLQLAPQSLEVEAAAQRLLERYFDHWVRPVRGSPAEVKFVRGFVEEWTCFPYAFSAIGNRVMRAVPLRRLSLRGVQRWNVDHLVRVKAFHLVRDLELRGLSDWPFHVLAGAGRFKRLERLALEGAPQGRPVALEGMLNSPFFAQLRALELELPLELDDAAAVSVAMGRLTSLRVRHHVPVAEAPALERLEVSKLVRGATAPLVQLLRKAPALRSLSLSVHAAAPLHPLVVEALPKALERLALSELSLGGAAVDALCAAEGLKRLRLENIQLSPARHRRLSERFGQSLEGPPVPGPGVFGRLLRTLGR
jgi:uncharacterized protein (TIGR02996 family)